MNKCEILLVPDERLYQISEAVLPGDPLLKDLVSDMFTTMYAADGIGLAANQIGVMKRIAVIDISRSNPLVLINPMITWKSPMKAVTEEGCLSIPGVTGKVQRSASVKVEYLDVDFNPQALIAHDLLSACIQHEIDHLNGILFTDK